MADGPSFDSPRSQERRGFFVDMRRPNESRIDIAMMREAIALARHGRQTAAPNPMVGCVLVRDGVVVGRGWHARPGEAHAEVMAIADAGESARGATAYVTLEPCNHTGRTGPCVDALINAGVSEVVYAVADPNPLAAGGAARLAAAGVATLSGVAEKEARELMRGWLHSAHYARPLVIAKVAMSLDGRIATRTGQSKWLTGAPARRLAHELRADMDAILVGKGTLSADDPALTARLDQTTFTPLRVVLDTDGSSHPGAKAYERSGRGALLVTTRACPDARRRRFEASGVDVAVCGTGPNGQVDLTDALAALHHRGVLSVMVEGGGAALGAFLDADLIDELHLFYAPILLGGGKPGFDGIGVDQVANGNNFVFDAPEPVGVDFVIRGRRRSH